MNERHELDPWSVANDVLYRLRHGGVLCTVVDREGRDNVLTLGWGQIGPGYHGHPIVSIAVSPLRYSWRFLEDVPEFVLALPDDSLRSAADLCGSASGRDLDKFAAAGLTRRPSLHVKAPSILECSANLECRVYARIAPPHQLLTPEHRQRPLEEQHTIYFAEVLAACRYGTP